MKRNTLLTLCAITALGATTAIGIVKATPAAPASATTVACVTRTWESTSSTNFSRDGNWSDNNAPDTDGEKALIPNITGGLVIPLMTASETVGALDIQNGGTLQTGAFTLTITAAGDCDGVLTIASGGVLNIQANGGVDLVSNVTHPVSGVLDIDAGGTLDIQAGATVNMDSANTHPIDGEIWLSGDGSTLKVSAATTLDIAGTIAIQVDGAVLDLDDNVTASGAGEIKGEHDDAQVSIATDKVLTSSLSMVGQMQIAGPGKLDNRGLVHANVASGTLLLGSNLIVVDTSGDRWDASDNSGAVLEFGAGIACDNLVGNFNLNGCATLKFNGTVYTDGSFNTGNGFVAVTPDNGSVCFKYSCNAECASCTEVCEDTSYGSCG